MQILKDIKENLEIGKAKIVTSLVTQAVEENIPAKDILDAMLSGMSVVGVKFKNNEIFVPEVLIAARALNRGLLIIKPILTETGIEPIGRAVIGTVEGDLHDIGKNLVKMMLVGAGIEVIDAGVDVSPEKFLEIAIAENCSIICMSALLTTTMKSMQKTVEYLKEQGVRDKYTIMIGGAPLTTAYASEIGADHYTPDAATAAEVAKAIFVA